LFKQKLEALAEDGLAEYEARASLWSQGRISDREYASAVSVLIAKATELEAMWHRWKGEAHQ
jgi:hypothetical protein